MKLIIGASGLLGSALSLAFKENEIPFIASGRKLDKLKDKLGEEVQYLQANLQNIETYTPALVKADTIILCVHALIEKGSNASLETDQIGIINLINACKKYGIKHIILFSIFGASPQHPLEFYRNKSNAELHLVQSGIPYTIIQCSAFMEMHIKTLIGDAILENKSVKMLGKGLVKCNFVAINDLVNFTLKLLTNGPFNKTIILGGVDNLSKQNVVQLYGEMLNMKPKVFSIPVPMLYFLATIIKPFHGGIPRLLRMAAFLDKNDCSIPFKPWPLEVPITSVKEFIESHINAHKQGL
jgi:uncharacterized protein YbjT (DUF2867 family)